MNKEMIETKKETKALALSRSARLDDHGSCDGDWSKISGFAAEQPSEASSEWQSTWWGEEW